MADMIPSRMSVHDNGYSYTLGAKLEVLLNGTPRDHVISYDIEARTLTRYCTDEKGNIIIDREADQAKRETLTGDVFARFKAG